MATGHSKYIGGVVCWLATHGHAARTIARQVDYGWIDAKPLG
jgi:hypothetical protein